MDLQNRSVREIQSEIELNRLYIIHNSVSLAHWIDIKRGKDMFYPVHNLGTEIPDEPQLRILAMKEDPAGNMINDYNEKWIFISYVDEYLQQEGILG